MGGGGRGVQTWPKGGGHMGMARGSFSFLAVSPIFLRHRPRPESVVSGLGNPEGHLPAGGADEGPRGLALPSSRCPACLPWHSFLCHCPGRFSTADARKSAFEASTKVCTPGGKKKQT